MNIPQQARADKAVALDSPAGATPGTASATARIPAQRWWRIIPPILMVCIVSYMDRVNIAFAMPGGMNEALGIGAGMAGLAGGIFFAGYLLLQIPGGKLAVRGSGRKFIGWSMLAWAVISVLTGLVRNETELLILRFALGVAEGGMLPVVLTIVGNWFPDHERGRANALVILFVPIAGMITAPLSGLVIAALDWRWLFIIEGGISALCLGVWLGLACDRPQEARWISSAERDYVLAQLGAEQQRAAPAAAATTNHATTRTVILRLLSDTVIRRLIGLNFLYQAGIYGYTLWLPTILKDLTHGGMGQVGLLAMVPYMGTMAGILVVSAWSDRSGKRRAFVMWPLLGFAACLAGSVWFHANTWLAYGLLVGCGVFLQAAAGVFWTLPPRLLAADDAGVARGLINALGNLGGFCGPYAVGLLIQYFDAGVGVYMLACALVLAAVLTATLPESCR
ncbi:MFS transporter [Cupriavidus consociatus]|uniref:MFS transporter n=1 Tax=Cupriavidus consociatus TaxID=2821357 RepID=UPI001AE603C0|nr:MULTISPECIES: MFS transporter [unclassified Cupriavidus]MBP0623654.1 MFS transporter [Cupriavidus sp. LEh25]MDK2660359.1 MFS transporter [Cupriavidus sp. LEh21]